MNVSPAMDASQEFSFRNEKYTLSNNGVLYEKLYQYYLSGKATDVTLVSSMPDEREFKCHKLILAAACEHFDIMFSGNWRELHETTINFPDLDSDTLELFVHFAYRGVVIINEGNIYNALCLSHRFGMRGLEHLCVRYLTERDVPTNCAIELFVFACAVHNTSLIPRLSQFILNNLSQFPKGAGVNGLLRMSLDNIETLLTNHQPLSLHKEVELWALLLYWTSEKYWKPWNVLQELAPLWQFYLFQPPQDFMEWLYDTTRLPYPSPVEIETKERLHLYVHHDANTCDLLEMYAYNDNGIFFHRTRKVPLCSTWKIKTLTVGDRLYLYKLRPRRNEYDLLFGVYSSVTLTNEQPLDSPGDHFNFARNARAKRAFNAASISGDSIHQRIYLLHSLRPQVRKELFWYDCGSDTWFNIDYAVNIDKQAEIITYFDHRLYLFERNRNVKTYDPRAGRWENVRKSGMLHDDSDRLCGHRGKLYVAGTRERANIFGSYHVRSEVYDPVAGRWAEMSPTSFPAQSPRSVRWLASLDSKLWMFGPIISEFSTSLFHQYPYNYHSQRFDPFLQRWSESRRVFRYPGIEGTIMDIIVFRSN